MKNCKEISLYKSTVKISTPARPRSTSGVNISHTTTSTGGQHQTRTGSVSTTSSGLTSKSSPSTPTHMMNNNVNAITNGMNAVQIDG